MGNRRPIFIRRGSCHTGGFHATCILGKLIIWEQRSPSHLHRRSQAGSRYHRGVMATDANNGISNRWNLFFSARMAVQV